ncbi:hypothetical protein [Burkholderia ubonensis]|uniref:hypothetical protein n=1 Tax=Burkholderia ubonensis TaxID=101571 RepID=UPI000A9AC5DD|nr:hypothetical protein [Burkholderia ubonensis]
MNFSHAGGGVRFSKCIFFSVICFICGVIVMSKSALADSNQANEDGFAVTALGDHQYGANGIGVWLSSERVRLGLSNTIDKDYDGIGLVESHLTQGDLKLAKDIHDQLCRAVEEKSAIALHVPPMMTYSLRCVRDGKTEQFQGKLCELPKELAFRLDDFLNTSIKQYKHEGRAIVKFDAVVTDVIKEKDKFLVSVKFVNSGRYPVQIRTPDQWSKLWGERLDISGFLNSGNGEWRADLAGLPVVNKGDLPVETIALPMGGSGTFVTIPAGGSMTFKSLAVPSGKVAKGTYEFGALVFTNVNVDGVPGVGGRVNFGSDRTKSGHVTFDTDFPSTPGEWMDYEARKRVDLSSRLVEPGSTIPAAGYYRAVSESGQRSQFLTEFREDTIAPVPGRQFHRWEWEADLAKPVRCRPNEVCPRDGRWVARTMTMGSSNADQTFYEHERRFRVGDLMPMVDTIGAPYLYWAWLGA